MKAIRIEKTIVSLENVRSVELHQSGSGAKSNPFRSTIVVEYQGKCEDARVWFSDDMAQTTGEKYMEKIMSILSEG